MTPHIIEIKVTTSTEADASTLRELVHQYVIAAVEHMHRPHDVILNYVTLYKPEVEA